MSDETSLKGRTKMSTKISNKQENKHQSGFSFCRRQLNKHKGEVRREKVRDGIVSSGL